jgi:hypothetical protein
MSHFIKMKESKMVLCHFIYLSFCQHVILPICYVIKKFYYHYQCLILSTCHFVNMSFCQRVILSTCHFVNVSFCQCGILSACHLVSMSFCLLVSISVSTCCILKLSFCQDAFCHFLHKNDCQKEIVPP